MLKYKLLEYLKSSDGFVSGEELGERLGVSRSAVWKEIRSLRNDGYNIEAVTNRGYVLRDIGDVLNSSEINTIKEGCVIGKDVVCYNDVDSTNSVCKIEALNGAEEGMVIVAETQSGGRGRLGRTWNSQRGEGVYMTVLLRPDIDPSKLSSITLSAGLAVCEALNKDFGLKTQIKWPNDIILNGKKICGILTEMSGQLQKVDFVVVGIGINVNVINFPDEIKDKATSIFIETGEKFKRSPIAKSVLIHFDEIYKKFVEKGFAAIKEDYEKNCVNIGRKVRVISRESSFEALVVETSDYGELVVLCDNGQKKEVFSGEVSVRGVY